MRTGGGGLLGTGGGGRGTRTCGGSCGLMLVHGLMTHTSVAYASSR